MKIDLHVHTVHSDGHWTAEEVLEAAKIKGLDGLVITDHRLSMDTSEPDHSIIDYLFCQGLRLQLMQVMYSYWAWNSYRPELVKK